MDRKKLTRKEIQKDLVAKINRKRVLSVFLTVFAVVGTIGFVLGLLHFDDLMSHHHQNPGGKLWFLPPTVRFVLSGIVLLFLVIFLWRYYYADLLRAKSGRFFVVVEKLYDKKKELIHYYRSYREEYRFYFPRDVVDVEPSVFSDTLVGEDLYMVCLNGTSKTRLVYSCRQYEIDEDSVGIDPRAK